MEQKLKIPAYLCLNKQTTLFGSVIFVRYKIDLQIRPYEKQSAFCAAYVEKKMIRQKFKVGSGRNVAIGYYYIQKLKKK